MNASIHYFVCLFVFFSCLDQMNWQVTNRLTRCYIKCWTNSKSYCRTWNRMYHDFQPPWLESRLWRSDCRCRSAPSCPALRRPRAKLLPPHNRLKRHSATTSRRASPPVSCLSPDSIWPIFDRSSHCPDRHPRPTPRRWRPPQLQQQ